MDENWPIKVQIVVENAETNEFPMVRRASRPEVKATTMADRLWLYVFSDRQRTWA